MDTTIHLAAFSAQHPLVHANPAWIRAGHGLAIIMVAVAALLAFAVVFGAAS